MQDVFPLATTLSPGLQLLLGLALAFLLGMVAGYLLRLWREKGASSGDAPIRASRMSLAHGGVSDHGRSSVSFRSEAFPAGAPEATPEPDRPANDRAAAAEKTRGAQTGGRRRTGSRRREGVTVLVADDRRELLAVHGAYLEQHGYHVLTATDGNTALALALSEHPSVIVLDHSMPGRSGIEVTRALKADPRTADIPVLLMTAHSYGAIGASARAAGIASFMAKPCEPSRLLREVSSFAGPGAGLGA